MDSERDTSTSDSVSGGKVWTFEVGTHQAKDKRRGGGRRNKLTKRDRKDHTLEGVASLDLALGARNGTRETPTIKYLNGLTSIFEPYELSHAACT